MNIKTPILIGLTVLIGTACARAETPRFPAVQPAQWTFHVANVSVANVVLTIDSRNGVPLYLLTCRSGTYSGNSIFNYSGDFECHLALTKSHPSGSAPYSTLLTEDAYQDKDWESRARYFAAELEPPCAQIPQFGRVRAFTLRGMRLTLVVTNATVVSAKLSSLTLHVEVQPDPSARRQIAAIVDFPPDIPPQCSRYFPDPRSFVTPRVQSLTTGKVSSVYKIFWDAPTGVWAANPYPHFYVMESSADPAFRSASRITTVGRSYIETEGGKRIPRYYRVRVCYIVPSRKKDVRDSLPIFRRLPYKGYYDSICSAWTGAALVNAKMY